MNPFLLISMLAPASMAHGTEAAEVRFSDTVVLLEGASYETGWLPESSPLAVKFSLETDLEADADMLGELALTWPPALTLSLEGIDGSGWLAIWGGLSLVTRVRLDVSGYTDEWEVDRRSLDLFGETFFDPLLLAGGSPEYAEVSTVGQGMTAFEISYEPVSGVGIGLDVSVLPAAEARLEGVRVDHNGEASTVRSGETAALAVPDDGDLHLESTYIGWWDTSMEVLLVPAVEVCVSVLGCYELASFEIPVDMGTDSFEDPFEPAFTHFELPVMVPPDDAYDFGEVELGNLANWNMPVYNDGVAWLQGEVGITGSSFFSAWPDFLLVDEDPDGVVVTFAPEEPGSFSATLVLATNDPANPTYQVLLTGTGVVPQENAVIQSEVGCGCAGARVTPGLAVLLLGLPLVVVRQRRRLTHRD